ncbi:MAG: MAPEG family protein, partial [Solirubrobacteraceae bacterium]
ALFALTIFVLMRLRSMRFAAVRGGDVGVGFYRAFQDGSEPEALRVVSRHFVNLFEMPVLFYVGVIMTYITHNVSGWMIGCAWAYVALRFAHSFVHLTSNDVRVRVGLYFASATVLGVMWATLLVDLLRSA